MLQIARSCSIGHGTVYEYLQRAQAVGVSWPLPEGWEDRQLEAALFGGTPLLIVRLRFAPKQAREDLFRLMEDPENRIIKRRVDALMSGEAIISEDFDSGELAMERLVGVIEIRRRSMKLRQAKLRRREKPTAAFSRSGSD